MNFKIKLKKVSRTSYDIVVVKSNSSFRGKVLDYIGSYSYLPGRDEWVARIDKIILSKWLVKGVVVTKRVNSLLRLK